MKHLLYFLLIGTLAFSCKKEVQPVEILSDSFAIEGQAQGIYNGIRVYLKEDNNRGTHTTTDTTMVMDERFKFEGQLDTMALRYLYVDAIDEPFPFILENGTIKITVDKTNILLSKISGTPINNAINTYNSEIKFLKDSLAKTYEIYKSLVDKHVKVSEVLSTIDSIKTTIDEHPSTFIKAHPKNPYALLLLENLIHSKSAEPKTIIHLFNLLDSTVVATNLGKEVSSQMEAVNAEQTIISATNIGQIAPELSAPAPNGRKVSLTDIKGKVILLDFWASWSKICRLDNPRKVALYDEYHDKGLEIISVSLDGSRTQTNPKSDWIKAIKEDHLNWHHVSNLNYFYDTIVKTYHIKEIPANFILNSDGKIIAKNLRYNELEDKIAELLH